MPHLLKILASTSLLLALGLPVYCFGDEASESAKSDSKPDYPPHAQVLKDYTKVVSTTDGENSMYTIYTREKDGQMLAELPRSFSSKKYFFATTISSGETYAGLQVADHYLYWRQYNNRLALISPNLQTRSTGDQESKDSVKRLFTDVIVAEVPILTMGPGGGPVIDMDAMLLGNVSFFFGHTVSVGNSRLVKIENAKAFPQNVEVAFEVPTSRGQLQTLHFSISEIPTTKYKPRKADERIGYFTTSFTDLGKYKDEETSVLYLNRWHLEKRDPSLSMSPPVKPITFYIEHTTPVRYRRWVREGILYWNKAFEKIGLSNAIEVHYQDKQLGTDGGHMDKDPEDVRYNFVRWLNNNVGTAIGPSRVNPLTGEILDADIILTDGWIRHYWNQYHEVMPSIAMEGFGPETLAWLAEHPTWDPRIRLAPPARRPQLKEQLARKAMLPLAGHPLGQVDATLMGDDQYDGLFGRTSQINGLCLASEGMAFDIAHMRMALEIGFFDDLASDNGEKKKDEDEDEKKDPAKKEEPNNQEPDKKDADKKDAEKKEEAKKEQKKDEELIDGVPEWFIGPLVAELVAHEVGHTLGLRHNFKASSVHALEDINSEKLKGKSAIAGSVMDYLPVNMRVECGELQGDYTMLGIGPYDMWAIEYGYTFDSDLDAILQRSHEPALQFATDQDTYGPDPLARRYDFSNNPLAYGQEQMKLLKQHREKLLEKFVKDGDSWSKARRGYELTIGLQMRAVSMMANWLGGAFINRDKKGAEDARTPIEVVPADLQRQALQFVIENTFEDGAYGLTPELLSKMTTDTWLDTPRFSFRYAEEPTYPVHDRIMGLQATTLTLLMQPTVLRRVYDNEFRVPADQDMITLPELLNALRANIWRELDMVPQEQYTARKPMVSSIRRNLQQEHLDRLITLAMPGAGANEVYKTISNLALMQMRELHAKIEDVLQKAGDNVDPYTKAHFAKMQEQISKALDSQYIYNANAIGGGSRVISIMLGNEEPKHTPAEN